VRTTPTTPTAQTTQPTHQQERQQPKNVNAQPQDYIVDNTNNSLHNRWLGDAVLYLPFHHLANVNNSADRWRTNQAKDCGRNRFELICRLLWSRRASTAKTVLFKALANNATIADSSSSYQANI
jgi:hypothetical protein